MHQFNVFSYIRRSMCPCTVLVGYRPIVTTILLKSLDLNKAPVNKSAENWFIESMSLKQNVSQFADITTIFRTKKTNHPFHEISNEISHSIVDIWHYRCEYNCGYIDSTSHSHYMNTHSIHHHPCFGLGAKARVPCAVSGAHTTIFWWVTVTVWFPFLETSHV